MHSIRSRMILFLTILLVIFLVLLNTYPLISARDLVFEEKKNSLTGQTSTVASSLSSFERLTEEGVSEVLKLLDIRDFDRTVVTDRDGRVLYDDGGQKGGLTELEDVLLSLQGKTVFRSGFHSEGFSSSCAMPVYGKGVLTGSVYLLEHDAEKVNILSGIRSRMLSASVIIGIGAVLVAVLLASVLLRRMQELVRSIRIVAGGDYTHRLTVSGRDEITELGEEFNRLTERLQDTEKQRRRFVSDASHELKTPLASIRLLSDSMVQNQGIGEETMREFASDITHEAERLQRTTEKLLDLSRLDDDVQIVPEPVDVKQTAIDALSVLRPLAEEKQVRLKCELDDGCVVMANYDDMFHILFNLMENAVKYNLPEGTVFVTLEAKEENIVVTVADTGIGIPEEDRLNIFARFYRVDKARSREAGGSGLGLSIVHDAVLAHGGTIAVGQNKPRGSKFIVSFPRPTAEETGI